jgi:hypothetical protein
VKDSATTPARVATGYEEFGVEPPEPDENGAAAGGPAEADTSEGSDDAATAAPSPVPSPFEIKENVIYHPPHISPRLRAQDSVLLACHQPLRALEDRDCLEITIRHDAHDDIRRRLDQYGVFDRQLFPDLDGIAKWLRYRVFESKGAL